MLQIRERIPTPSFDVFTFGLTLETYKEFGGVSKARSFVKHKLDTF
jgi:hypothetical protein